MSLLDEIRTAKIRAAEQVVVDHLRRIEMPIADLMGDTVPKTVPATSEERVVNNVMRHEYRVLTADEKVQMRDIKDMGLQFHEYLTRLGTSDELNLAKVKMEEAVMWAVKHLTK